MEKSQGKRLKLPRSSTMDDTAVAKIVESIATSPVVSINAMSIGPRSERNPTSLRLTVLLTRRSFLFYGADGPSEGKPRAGPHIPIGFGSSGMAAMEDAAFSRSNKDLAFAAYGECKPGSNLESADSTANLSSLARAASASTSFRRSDRTALRNVQLPLNVGCWIASTKSDNSEASSSK